MMNNNYETELFNRCFNIVLRNEGWYVNDPDDKGGETFRGIARRWHGTWKGWIIIDMKKIEPNFPENLKTHEGLDILVKSFYKSIFWDRMNLSMIVNENSILQIFDTAVMSGIKPAVRMAQRCCDGSIAIDGILGHNTAFEINSLGYRFFNRYVKQRIAFYKAIVEKRPSNTKFLKGWIRRAKNTKF